MRSRPLTLALVLLIGLVGCGDDDCPTCPPEVGRGTITISPEPSGINAPWVLGGPAGFNQSSSGEATIKNINVGSYTLTWGDVAGWVTPSAQTENLAAGGTVSFSGVFVPEGFVYIPPGTFVMGSPEDEPGRFAGSEAQHQVTLTQGFYMSKYEVTERWWYEVMGGEPTTSQLPRRYVSWDMAVQFCNAMSNQEGLTPAYTINGPNGDVTWNQSANGYRLPTEAEWEYACRATTTLAFNNNTNCLSSDTEANYNGNYPLDGCPPGVYHGARTEVGSFPANQWGLYDMHGNLWEWVWDGYRADYENLPSVDPVHNVEPGAGRVLRGGLWDSYARRCRSANRLNYYPSSSYDSLGFRPVRSAF